MPAEDKTDKPEKKEKKKKLPELTPDGKPWPNGPDGKPLEVGPDGKPVPPVPLTEIQQVQLNIDNATDEVTKLPFMSKPHKFLIKLIFFHFKSHSRVPVVWFK